MKRICILAAAVPFLALVALAQEDAVKDKMKAELEQLVAQSKVMYVSGGAMGPTVKGAPYSATEVTESNHVLADGTRIHNQSQTTVYRDSEGRVRRETPSQTTIMDPVAGVTYFLNPKTMTATKGTLALPMVNRRVAPDGQTKALVYGTAGGTLSENSTFEVRTSKEGTSMTVNGKPVDPSTVKVERSLTLNGMPVDEQTFAIAQDKMKAEMAQQKMEMAAHMAGAMAGPIGEGVMRRNPGKTEALGKQMIEGVNADGTRVTTTLEAGAIGNDRPIQMVNERWYSSELQTVVMTKHTDPRTGEEIFKLTNVSRSEPGADLFQVPTSYQINDRK